MEFLEFVTPPPAIYHGCSTRKKFWEEKSTPAIMTSCGRRNVGTYRDINNGEQYIVLDISFKLDCLEKVEVTSSESWDYTGRTGKGLTTSLALRTKSPKNKQKKIPITDITH